MKIDDGGFNGMMNMPYGHMSVWIIAAILIVLLIGFGVGYSVGRSK